MNIPKTLKNLTAALMAVGLTLSLAACSEPIKPLEKSNGTRQTGTEETGSIGAPLTFTEDGEEIGVDIEADIYDGDGDYVGTFSSGMDEDDLRVTLPIGEYTAQITVGACRHSDDDIDERVIECVYLGENPYEFTILAGVSTPFELEFEMRISESGSDGPVVYRDGDGVFEAAISLEYVEGDCDQCNGSTEACVRPAPAGEQAPADPVPELLCLERCGGSYGGCSDDDAECVFVAPAGSGPSAAFGVCESDEDDNS